MDQGVKDMPVYVPEIGLALYCIEHSHPGHTPLIQKWIQDLPEYVPESAQRLLQALLDKTVVEGLNFVKRNAKYQKVFARWFGAPGCMC